MDTRAAVRSFQENPQVAQQATEQLQQLLSRSATDMDFRRKLLTDPRAAMVEFSGREGPSDVNIVFVENTVDATIVLPDPVDPAAQLSESELETVAGGLTPATVVASVVLVSAITNAFFQGRNDGQEH